MLRPQTFSQGEAALAALQLWWLIQTKHLALCIIFSHRKDVSLYSCGGN